MPHRLASLCRACAQLVLFTALVAGVVDPAQGQSSQNINAQVNALLGAYENLASPARWRSLGDAAVPILESVVADYTALPTRRARAIDGLAALSSGSATMQRVANSDWEPLVVRISAVNGLAQVLPESDLIPALRPLLNDPQSQMRGITAKALSNTPAGCAEIAAMAQLETPAWRARYVRTCGGNTNSADQPPVGGGKTLVDKFMFTQIVDIFDPTGTKIYDIFNPPPNINQFDQPIIGGFSLLLPNSPTLAFPSGSWSFDTFVAGFHPDTMDVQALIKTGPTPTLTSGKLNANLFFLTSALGLDAKTAQSDPNFQAILSKVRSIYAQIGLELGDLTYIDITGDDLVRFEILEPNDEPSLFMLSNHPKARDGAINIFLVFTIDENGMSATVGGFRDRQSVGLPRAEWW